MAPGQGHPPAWQPWTFAPVERDTQYRLIRDAQTGQTVLEAEANRAGSALRRVLPEAARNHRLLRWRWKAPAMLENANIAESSGDDAVARVLVIYAYDPARLSFMQRAQYALGRALYGEWPPHAILSYVWARRHQGGAVVPNPASARAQVIVVADAETPAGQWQHYERDLHADYRRVFGQAPPPVYAIGVMTDTDVSGETARASYADITLSP